MTVLNEQPREVWELANAAVVAWLLGDEARDMALQVARGLHRLHQVGWCEVPVC